MSDRLFWVLAFLAAIGLAALFGVVHTGIEYLIARRREARHEHPYYDQPTHCRVVDQRQEHAS